MKIAQVSPLYESVPPKYYGGTERVVSYLTEELIRQGHEVTLFASGDSQTKAELIHSAPQALRLSSEYQDHLAHHVLLLEEVVKRAHEFDIIHFHLDYIHFPLVRSYRLPHITTLHGRLDLPDLQLLFMEYKEMPLVSISMSQRTPLLWVNWQGLVYHGLPKNLYSLEPKQGGYLAFLGRISPEKGVDRAIEIATRAGMKLIIAAKIDALDRKYFEEDIKPLLDNPLVEFIGEIGEPEKKKLLCGACALVFPIDWPEPFGMVMIESMACGTPVIAYNRGSVPEIIDEGVTGFVVNDLDGAVRAVEQIPLIDRRRCREVFEKRFSAERMAHDYLTVYERVAGYKRVARLAEAI